MPKRISRNHIEVRNADLVWFLIQLADLIGLGDDGTTELPIPWAKLSPG